MPDHTVTRARRRRQRIASYLAALAALGLLLCGCLSTPSAPAVPSTAVAAPRDTAAPPSSPEPTTLTPTTLVPRDAENLTEVTVTRVIDGDTIEVLVDGESYRVRYIGIDAPETGSGYTAFEWLSTEATLINESLVGGRTVHLETDVSDTDRYDRLLRYVWVGDTLVNEVLVRLGYARSVAYPPDTRYQDILDEAQSEARAAGVGIWGPQPTGEPAAAPAVTPASRDTSDSGVALPDGCNYVGNKNSKKFHCAACSSVAAMSPANRVCFASREDAIAAGYQPCQRCNP